MTKNGNSKLKREVRARMAETGENYTTTLHHIEEEWKSAARHLKDSRETRERLLHQRADAGQIAEVERLIELRERELAAIEKLMTQPTQGGNAHRGRGVAQHRTGQRA